MGGRSLLASSIEKFKAFVKSREERLSYRGVGLGLETHYEQEWRLVGNGVGGRVMQELSHQ